MYSTNGFTINKKLSIFFLVIVLVVLNHIGVISGKRTPTFKSKNATTIELYYESLCPFSTAFITEQLWPTYLRLGYLVNLHLVPFGNAFEEEVVEPRAEISSKSLPKAIKSSNLIDDYGQVLKLPANFSCQHGPAECYGNILQSCAILLFKEPSLNLAFITCMSSADRPNEVGKVCAETIGLDWKTLDFCASTYIGLKSMQKMGESTWNLDPPHQYVPWVVVNGVHSDEIQAKAQNDLMGLVCDSLKDHKPPACQEELDDRVVVKRLAESEKFKRFAEHNKTEFARSKQGSVAFGWDIFL